MNPTTTMHADVAAASEPTEANTTDMSRVPRMMFIDNEGLEEQFLTGDEASQEVMDITANRVTMPVDNDAAPLNPIYMQRSQQDEELDQQLSRGSRDESLGEALNQFLDDNYKDVLRTSNFQTRGCPTFWATCHRTAAREGLNYLIASVNNQVKP